VHDIPLELNVTFVPRAPNPAPNATLKSKACAEPPMALAVAAFLAVRSGIQAARAEAADPPPPLQLDAPLTPARVQAACLVDTAQFTLH
jgi:xanthine dehydrogenase/oxidase